MSKILHIPINLKIETENLNVSSEKALELRVLGVFQMIDSLGNYINPKWFNDLNNYQLKKFLKELNDIWTYRAGLLPEIQHNICPPIGRPFRNFNLHILNNNDVSLIYLKKSALEIIENFLCSPDDENRKLGANLILCALTLVSHDAAIALPWFYEAVTYQ
jgi:hypothetical protein